MESKKNPVSARNPVEIFNTMESSGNPVDTQNPGVNPNTDTRNLVELGESIKTVGETIAVSDTM